MSDLKVFHKSVRGASHITSGKPCQDYSASFDEDGIQIVVVCDGHGGSTYVRSDIGAKLAAENAIDCLRNFVRCISDDVFLGKSFSITAQPKHNPFVDVDGCQLRFEDMDDTQRQWAKQASSYCDSEEKCIEQQKIVKDLLNQIYNAWVKAIALDAKKHSFNKKEQTALKDSDISKAYGCTMLAFLRTPKYWLAFQIGDGTIYCCDNKLSWIKPVPDDYTCFLNYTTSLCDADPLLEFRYAFSGLDDMPIAVMLCSDGLDGSLRTEDNLQDFYEQIIGLYSDGDNVEEELHGFLPKMSADGNHDDISIAGIVDLESIKTAEIQKKMDLKKREREIKSEYRTKKTEIDAVKSRIEMLTIKLDRQKDAHFMKQTELDELRQEVSVRENEVSEIEKTIEAFKSEIKELNKSLKVKEAEFDDWRFTIKTEMANLEYEQQNEDDDNASNQNNIQNR